MKTKTHNQDVFKAAREYANIYDTDERNAASYQSAAFAAFVQGARWQSNSERERVCACGHLAHQHKQFFKDRRMCRKCDCPAFINPQSKENASTKTTTKLEAFNEKQGNRVDFNGNYY